jgi:hypothetical protein
VTKRTENPVTRRAEENTAAQVWDVDLSDALPFGCEAVAAISALADGVIETATSVPVFAMPHAVPAPGRPGRRSSFTGPNPCAARST